MASPTYMTLMVGPVQAVLASKALMDAFISAEVNLSATGRSGFQLSFTLANNSPLQLQFLLSNGAPVNLTRVILIANMGGLPQVIMDGMVQHLEIQPDAMQGASMLTISGEDLTAMMDLTDKSGHAYPAQSPDNRVRAVLENYAVFGIVPDVQPVPAPDVDAPPVKVPSQDGTDLEYINQLAREVGYVFYIDPGPLPGSSRAYWGPQVRIGIPQPALNVNMDAWTNVESLNFTYDPQTAVMPFVMIQDPATGIQQVPIPSFNPLNPPLGVVSPMPQKTKYLDYTAKLTAAQGWMAGMALARDTGDTISGTGTLSVVRYGGILRARELVGVRGAGSALDGVYYVSSTNHQIKPGEYKQGFTLKRNALVSETPLLQTVPF